LICSIVKEPGCASLAGAADEVIHFADDKTTIETTVATTRAADDSDCLRELDMILLLSFANGL